MGASEWQYFMPYQPNIQKAFETLQRLIFEGGHYYWRGYKYDDIHILVLANQLCHELSLSIEEIERLVEPLYEKLRQNPTPLPIPQSIEELREQNAENGTHSILDIRCVSETQGGPVAAPLSPAQLTAYFGTDKPTRTMIDKAMQRKQILEYWRQDIPIQDLRLNTYLQLRVGRTRGEGTYIIIYKDDNPDEILFTGYSGD